KIKALGKPVVLVLLNGSAVSVNWAQKNLPAIVEAWYPGQAAGQAIADVLFGDYNPAGRLPVTFYKSVNQLPVFTDYNMKSQTYRYFKDDPLYSFGYGLSYTTFGYDNLQLPSAVESGGNVAVSVDVTNSGKTAGEEVVQLYVSDEKASVPVPIRSLEGFKRIFLKPGETKKVQFTLTPWQLSIIDKNFKRIVEPGTFTVSVGGKQPEMKGSADAKTTGVVSRRIKIVGKEFYLE
ncbi:MAG: glucan 1,4-alpha-glucosidase, partial [Calditrichaeota bacterium]|nr:glucan 1,4-alpha-glucosidase [Calditrichota bacterium]